MRKLFILHASIYLVLIQAAAQQRQFDRPMQLIACSINVKANLFTATTFIEMEFYNDNAQEIEGLFHFQLRPEQMITAFQLDLFGKYRDGSIEEKWKARNAYNTIVGKRVDPALLTMNGIGQYSLNIYPVPAKGSRKITMTIDQVLKVEGDRLLYELPLSVQNIVKEFQLTIRTENHQIIPGVEKGLIENKTFSNVGDQYALDWETKELYLQKAISFSLPLTGNPVVCTTPAGKETVFAMRFKPGCETEFEIHPQKITVFWDASSSGRHRDINREINFLKQFVSFHNIKQLTLIPFNHELIDTAVFYTSAGFNSRWESYLRDMKYEGATQLGRIDLTGFSSDLYFIFTDGINTYGRAHPVTGTGQVYCVHSSYQSNDLALKKITGTSGGRIINLNTMNLSQAISINSKGMNWLMSISSSTGKTVIDQQLPFPLSKDIFLNGTMFAGNDTLIIRYGSNNRVTAIQKIYLPGNTECDGSIERIPAFKRFQELLSSHDWESVLEFGLKEKMVTANAAFIVLEKVEDYIKYNITPPKELEKQCEELQFVKKDTRSQRQRMRLADEFEVLANTVSAYNEKIRKWDNKSPLIVLTRTDFNNAIAGRVETNNIAASLKSQNQPSVTDAIDAYRTGGSGNTLNEVVVTSALGIKRVQRTMAYSSQVINNEQLNIVPQTNIVDALAGKVAGVQVRSQSDALLNQPGSLRIRGGLSLADVEPLYVIDGTPVTAFDVNPADINDVTVLKGANATSLFGSRAAGGAIVINTKKRNHNGYNYYNNKPYRLKDMEDVEYISDIKETLNREKYQTYMQLREHHSSEPGFYFDMAQHFFESGLKNEAYEILMNAAEESQGGTKALKTVGFILESWEWFDKAIEVYGGLAENDPSKLEIQRDLALAWYQLGNYQQAVTILYNAIIRNMYDNEYAKTALKATMLNEMNAIIALHKDSIEISFIPSSLIRPLSSDLRIIIECNASNLNNISIKEPGGETCSYANPVTKKGFIDNNYYWYDVPVEYQTKNAKEGRYKIVVNSYYNSWEKDVPDLIRIMTFKNFGKPGQQIKIENVIMDNQYGEVEIGEVRW